MDRRDRHLVARTYVSTYVDVSRARCAFERCESFNIPFAIVTLDREKIQHGHGQVNTWLMSRGQLGAERTAPRAAARRPLVGYVVIALRALPHAWDHANHARDPPLIDRSALPHISQRHTRAISDISPTRLQFVTHTAYRPACPGSW